jgi:hypothetical protein
MKRYFGAIGWAVIGLIALVCLNLIFFGFVVGLDVMFGAAPQFTVPMFVPLLICGGTIVMLLLRKSRQPFTASDSTLNPASETQSSGHRNRRPQAAVLHSMLIIRRQPARRFSNQERRSYESSI